MGMRPPHIIQTIPLPRSGAAQPGPLHTIVSDAADNLYYSDEINHSIVSLDDKRQVRWQRTACGSAPGEFQYPRGLSIGWVERDGQTVQCVAICDAWNRRVQFLDLSGNPVLSWTGAGQKPFGEVADVRFIAGDFNQGRAGKPMSFWFVLDRGNHRLCAMSLGGQLLFEIGRGFPPHMGTRWAVPGLFLESELEHAGLVKDFPALDFTFYPERILGDSENALYVWEPSPRILRQVLLGNLLPVRIAAERPLDWVSADESGLIGWDRPRRLLFYGWTGELEQTLEIAGNPIGTSNSPEGFWLQCGRQIERWARDGFDRIRCEPRFLDIRAPLLRTAQAELERFDGVASSTAIRQWTAVVDDGLALADEVLTPERDEAAPDLNHTLAALCDLPHKLGAAEQRVHETLHGFCLGTLECHLSGSPNGAGSNSIAGARKRWAPLFEPIRTRFAPLAARLDDLRARRLGIAAESLSHRRWADSWCQAAGACEEHLQRTLEWIYRWSGVVEGTQELLPLPWILPLPETLRDQARAPGHAASRRSRWSYTPKPSRLREVHRMPLGAAPSPLHPHGLAFLDERLFVSLNGGHEVVELHPAGNVTRRIGTGGSAAGALRRPAGIVFDGRGRLWVVDSENRRVVLLDLERGSADRIPSGAESPWLNCHPFGIGRMADGSMLVSDSGNRLVRVRLDGAWDIHTGIQGTGLGEFRNPTQVSPGLGGTLWIVDRNNHRVQKLDSEGRCLQAIGRCGLGHGELFTPESVAQFEDGVVAVAQNRWNRCIKLFTPEGVEFDRTVLTYFAEGMRVHGGRLYVAAMDQDAIVVYEREQGT